MPPADEQRTIIWGDDVGFYLLPGLVRTTYRADRQVLPLAADVA